ncbi:MAG TPA: patatin-like phospholipase family protein [Paludibacter sp.]|nr:patatin-like phospholipase family protein [Paludibacter sp.]
MKIIRDLFNFSSRNDDTLGICLGGGAALGFAHIGVLQSLEDHGIYPTHIVGSSMGAIVGTLYAAGYTPKEMLQMIKDDKLYKITTLMTFRPGFLRSGLSAHTMLRALIRELIPHNSFEQLKKKMYVCVVNLNTAEWEFVSSGNELDKWVAASASIPGLFETIKQDEIDYIDGGVLNNMPAQGIKDLCQTIIGVDVIPHKAPTELKKPIDTLAYAVRAMQHQNSKEGRDLCRYLIEPQAIEEFHEFSFDAYLAIYQHGYSAATKYILENPEMMKLGKIPAELSPQNVII